MFYVFTYVKQGYHSDEVWNYGYANSFYTKELTESNEGESYLNQWMDSQMMKDYITVDSEHRFAYGSILENTKKDLNPPLQYFILHTICSFFPGVFSWYFCFAINIVSLLVSQVYLYKLVYKMTDKNDLVSFGTIILYGFGMGATNITLFMRIYALAVMFVVLFAYSTYEIYANRNEKKIPVYKFVRLFVVLFLGAYTLHLFLLVAFCITLLYSLYYLFTRKIKVFFQNGLVSLGAALLSIAVFPSIFYHVGNDVSSNLYGRTKYPFPMQMRFFSYLLTKDLFGVRISPFPNPYLEWFLIGLGCLIVLLIPVFFIFRKDQWFQNTLVRIKDKFVSIIKKWKNCNVSIIIYVITVITVLIVASLQTSVYYMGNYSSRYIFVVYPLAVISAVMILYYLVILISEKRLITGIIVMITCIGLMVWTHLYEYHRDYFFEAEKEGVTIDQIENDANSVIILGPSANWTLVCFPPLLYDTNSYYATNYYTFRDNEDIFYDIDKNKPCYIILDSILILPDDVTHEEAKDNAFLGIYADYALYEDEFIDYFLSLDEVEKMELVGKDSYMKRKYNIYKVSFDKQ